MSGPPAPLSPRNPNRPLESTGAGDSGLAHWPWGVLLGAWLTVAAVHLLSLPADRLLRWPLGYLVLEVLACASLAYRAWRAEEEGRLAWWLLAASAGLEVPNLVVTLALQQGVLSARLAWASSFLSLGTGLLVLAGVLSFPRGQERWGMFRRRVLDALIFAAALLFLLWVLGIQGSLGGAPAGVGMRVFVAYLNLALLGGGLIFMTSYHADRVRGPLGWLGASALAWLGGITCWTLAGLPGAVSSEPWILLAGGIPVFQGMAAWSPRKVEEALAGADPGRRGAGLLPYLPAAIAILALAALLAWAPGAVTRATSGIFLGLVVLLLLRQLQSIQDLTAARHTLEARVRERTRALEQAQDTLLKTERMNTLALMGAGLAHDLNNLLCAMKSSAELAVGHIEAGGVPATGDLTRIASTADRAATLTRRLMGFVRREAEELLPTDLGRELLDMEPTLRFLVPSDIHLRLEVIDPAPMVRTSRLRVEQMLVNLVANARDAMPDGGSLVLRIGWGGPQGEHALIEVTDSGLGMSPEVLERIFEPFFTTKPPGKGTGLGLSSLKAIVEEGGGTLEVRSQPGRGSEFRILLPQVLPG